jgi:hypothetical protein
MSALFAAGMGLFVGFLRNSHAKAPTPPTTGAASTYYFLGF